jgi:HAD superfamily hydrolase (TIGR01509 family)
MFDEFLAARAAREGGTVQPFDLASDYPQYVDGKPRYDGVRSFLASRGITLAEGEPDDPPGRETVTGLGNRKNDLIRATLATEGVDVYEGSVALVRHLRAAGVKTAVVSSSRNAEAVLRAAGIADLFDDRIDGNVAKARQLAGKPSPDTFLAGAAALGVEPARAVVVEDAIAGVAAGRAGRFGLVIGVDREGRPEALRASGADIVVADLAELVPA